MPHVPHCIHETTVLGREGLEVFTNGEGGFGFFISKITSTKASPLNKTNKIEILLIFFSLRHFIAFENMLRAIDHFGLASLYGIK